MAGNSLVVLALLPVYALCYSLHALSLRVLGVAGRALGATLYHLRFRRKVITGNLELAFGATMSPPELHALTRAVYASIGTTFLEIARNFALSKEEMRNELIISPSDRAYIQERLQRGRGVIFVSAHISNWELLAMGVAAHGFPVAIVVKKMSARISQFLIERQRKKTDLEIIYSGGTIEKMRAALLRGKVIGFMVDQNTTGKKAIRANFFGVPASSIRGLAKLVKDSGTAVIPICAFRQSDGTHRVKLLPELSYLSAEPGTPAGEIALREEFLNTQQYQLAVETLIRFQPEQWLWIHRRWKARRDPLCAETAHRENQEQPAPAR